MNGAPVDEQAVHATAKRLFSYRVARERAARISAIRSIIGTKPSSDAELIKQKVELGDYGMLARFGIQVRHFCRLFERSLHRAGMRAVHFQNVQHHKIFERREAGVDASLHRSSPSAVAETSLTDVAEDSTHGGNA